MASIRDIFMSMDNPPASSPLLRKYYPSMFSQPQGYDAQPFGWTGSQTPGREPYQFNFERYGRNFVSPLSQGDLPGTDPSSVSTPSVLTGENENRDGGDLSEDMDIDVPSYTPTEVINELSSRGMVPGIAGHLIGLANPIAGLAAKGLLGYTPLGDWLSETVLEWGHPGLSFEGGIGSYDPQGGFGLGNWGTTDMGLAQALDESFAPGYSYDTETGMESFDFGADQGWSPEDPDEGYDPGGYGDDEDEGEGSGNAGADAADEDDAAGDDPDWYKGGYVSQSRLTGPDPAGPDTGRGNLQAGEYVVSKAAVDKYGTDFFDAVNKMKIKKGLLSGLM